MKWLRSRLSIVIVGGVVGFVGTVGTINLIFQLEDAGRSGTPLIGLAWLLTFLLGLAAGRLLGAGGPKAGGVIGIMGGVPFAVLAVLRGWVYFANVILYAIFVVNCALGAVGGWIGARAFRRSSG